MNNIEKTDYSNKIIEYSEEKRLFSIFEELYKLLAIEQPDNPIDFMLNILRNGFRFLKRKKNIRGWSSRD